jgi:hypothetical protein
MVDTITAAPPVPPATPGAPALAPIKKVDGKVKLNPRYVVAGMVITLGGKPCVVANDLTIDAGDVSDDDLRKLGPALA